MINVPFEVLPFEMSVSEASRELKRQLEQLNIELAETGYRLHARDSGDHIHPIELEIAIIDDDKTTSPVYSIRVPEEFVEILLVWFGAFIKKLIG